MAGREGKKINKAIISAIIFIIGYKLALNVKSYQISAV